MGKSSKFIRVLQHLVAVKKAKKAAQVFILFAVPGRPGYHNKNFNFRLYVRKRLPEC